MTELSPAARALIDAARDGMTPSAAALRRVRGRVDAAAVGSAGGMLVAKLSLVVVVAGIVAGAVALRSRRGDAALPAVRLESSSPIEPARSERVNEAAPAPRAEAPHAIVEPRHAPVAKTDDAPKPVGLAREVELVDAAMTALKAGDPRTALASVRVHREETRGAGQLAEDVAAIEIEALCRLHDRRVVAKLEAFDLRWPESAQRSRLSTNCP